MGGKIRQLVALLSVGYILQGNVGYTQNNLPNIVFGESLFHNQSLFQNSTAYNPLFLDPTITYDPVLDTTNEQNRPKESFTSLSEICQGYYNSSSFQCQRLLKSALSALNEPKREWYLSKIKEQMNNLHSNHFEYSDPQLVRSSFKPSTSVSDPALLHLPSKKSSEKRVKESNGLYASPTLAMTTPQDFHYTYLENFGCAGEQIILSKKVEHDSNCSSSGALTLLPLVAVASGYGGYIMMRRRKKK